MSRLAALILLSLLLAAPAGACSRHPVLAVHLKPSTSRWLPAGLCPGLTVLKVRAYRRGRRVPRRFYDLVELADGYHPEDLGPLPPATGRGRFYVYSTYPRKVRILVWCG